jgi:hypothetical protein
LVRTGQSNEWFPTELVRTGCSTSELVRTGRSNEWCLIELVRTGRSHDSFQAKLGRRVPHGMIVYKMCYTFGFENKEPA